MKPDAPWHLFLANVPRDRDDPAFGPLLRVFADPTASQNWGVYNHKSEGHQVVNFFENFRLDLGNHWVRWLLRRLGMEAGHVHRASWSYELEEPTTYSLADVTIGFRDADGPGVIVIEAKRVNDPLARGISPKDDPRSNAYVKWEQFSGITRKAQILLISSEAEKSLEPELRASSNLLTWDEFASVQRSFLEAATNQNPEFRRALRLHHGMLGLALDDERLAIAPECFGPPTKFDPTNFIQGVNRYVRFAKNGEIPSLSGWLLNEPGRSYLLEREAQTGSDRQHPYWKTGTAA